MQRCAVQDRASIQANLRARQVRGWSPIQDFGAASVRLMPIQSQACVLAWASGPCVAQRDACNQNRGRRAA